MSPDCGGKGNESTYPKLINMTWAGGGLHPSRLFIFSNNGIFSRSLKTLPVASQHYVWPARVKLPVYLATCGRKSKTYNPKN